jgi:hypothetical protein
VIWRYPDTGKKGSTNMQDISEDKVTEDELALLELWVGQSSESQQGHQQRSMTVRRAKLRQEG